MEEDTSKCVVVRGFPVVVGEQLESLKDKLQIYFQSFKASGGGDVGHLEMVEPGVMKIQFTEEEAAKNVLARGHHQINVFGQDYPLEVLPYSPAPTQQSQPHDAGQHGSTVEENIDQDEHSDNETAGHQSTDDHPMSYPRQTTEVPTFPNPYTPYGSMTPTYPQNYPGYQPNQPIPGPPSTGIQEADLQHPSYETVCPGGMAAPSNEMQPSGTESEKRPQIPEDSQAFAASPEGVSNSHLHPQNPYPRGIDPPDPRVPHGELHPQARPQGQIIHPARFHYPNVAFRGPFPLPQNPGPRQPPIYPEDMTPTKEMEASGTDSEDRPQSQEDSSTSAAPPEGDPNPNYPHQNPYQFPGPDEGPHGETHSYTQTHPQGHSQQLGVQYPFPHPHVPGPRQSPTYPGDTTESKEMGTSATDSEGHHQKAEDSSASATPPERDSNPTQPSQNLYQFPGPQGHSSQPTGVQYPNPAFRGPFPHPHVPGSSLPPTYPVQMNKSQEMGTSATDSEGHSYPQDNPSASTTSSKGAPVIAPNYPGPHPYPFQVPQGAHGKFHPQLQAHLQGQNLPPTGVIYPNPGFQGSFPPPGFPGHRQPPGFRPRHPYGYPYGYPYPAVPAGYPYMSAPPPNQWPYPHQWMGHGHYPEQNYPTSEPPQEPTIPKTSQPEDTDDTFSEDNSTVTHEQEEGTDLESMISVTPTEEDRLSVKQDEEDNLEEDTPQGSEEEKPDEPAGKEDNAAAIEVTGLSGDEFKERREVIRLYFENTKRSGGGEIHKFDIDSEKDRLLITFKDKEAPGRVMQKSPHQIGKRKMNVRMVKCRPELPTDPTRILLKGVADNVNKETLFLYLESMSGFEDEPAEIFHGKEAGTVMVAFVEPISDLDSLLVTCKSRELEQQTISAEKVHDTDCIQVTGIPSEASRDNLFYYFESTKRSGGGSVSEVHLDKDQNSALIFFDDHTVIERVLKKSHSIQKKTVTVGPFYTCLGATIPVASFVKACEQSKRARESPISVRPKERQLPKDTEEEKDKTVAIEVTGLTGDELEDRRDVLYYYFENTKRSGGGDISKFDIDSEKDRVLIVFEDKEAPGRVMQKTHEVVKKKLKVRTVKPRPELPVDPTRILLKGVADSVTEETLFLFLEAMCRGQHEPTEIFYGKEVGTVMIAFEDPISDLDSLLTRCTGRELEKQTMSAEKVHDTDCIQVTGIPSTASRDNLYYYFENTKRIGGGPVAEVQLDKDQGTALVHFDDHTVITRVLKQRHTIQNTTVTVEPFYTCLGATVAEAKTPPQLVPLPITENVTPPIASFVMNHPSFKQALDTMMTKAHAYISWPVGGDQATMEITTTLTKKTPDLANIAENWAPNARKGLKSFLARFDTKEIADVMQASWPEVCKLAVDDTLKDDDTISVHSTGTSDRKIIFTGLKKSVLKHYQRVLEGIKKIEEDIKRRQSEEDETVSQLKPEQVRLLAMSNFKDRMTSKFPKLQMAFDTKGSEIKFHGLLDEIQQTKVTMYETVHGVTSQSVKLSPTMISFIANAKEPEQHLLGEYKQGSVVAVITTTTGEIEVFGLSDGDAKKAVSILEKTFQEQRLDVSDQSTSVLATEEWQKTKTALEKSAQGLLKISVESSVDSGATKILFTGESVCVKDMAQRVNSYLRVKTIHEQRVEADDGVIRFIKEYQLSTLQIQLETHQVSVCCNGSEESPTMTVKGNIDGIQKAGPILQTFIDSVKSDQMSIKKPGMSKHFREQAGRSTLQHVERQCKCVINIQDAMKKTPAPDPDTFAKQFMPTSPTTVAQEKAVVKLDSGKKLVVWRDDITKHKVDVIVNAANARLEHTGGLAKAIVDAGGDVIQKFCNDYIQANGPLIPGQVMASLPGRINTCQRILHAVGPIWQGGSVGEEDRLGDAVYGCLEQAAQNNFRSIAIPAVSSGIYGYPLKKCAETIVTTTVEYLDDNPDTSLDVVEFVNINDQTGDAFVDALVSVFGEDKVEKTFGQVGQPTTTTRPQSRSARRRGRGGGSQPGEPSTAPPYTPSMQPRDPVADVGFRTTEGKAIIAIQANIASQNVDVLVNTTAGNLNLNTGAVSRAILQLAGSDLQALVNRAKQRAGISSLPDGQILVTDSADLSCKQVIHCVLCSWDGGQGNSEKVLRKLVRQCLQQAEQGNYASIAIPAMGTGGLRFPHDVVAEAMFNEAVEHCRTNPSGSLREIRFIVWEGDPKSIPAFNEVMTKYKAMHTSGPPPPTSRSDVGASSGGARRGRSRRGGRSGGAGQGAGRTDTPDYRPQGASSAAPSLFSDVTNPVRGALQMLIGDLTLNVRKGDLTKETTDCIVNSSNEQLDLTRGAVSNAICKAGGPDIARECASIAACGDMRDGIAVTGAGKLKCKKIIHAAAPATDWKKVIIDCLRTAETNGFNSIAFPALGTGVLQESVARTATTMLDALQDFVLQYKPTKLNEVRITIFQQNMVRAFHEEMRKRVGQPIPQMTAKSSGLLGKLGRMAAAGWSYVTGSQASKDDDQPIPSPDNVVVFLIYSDNPDSLFKAKEMINKTIDETSKDETIPSKFKLTEEQKQHVRSLALRHDCLATFTRSNIRIQGRTIDVVMATHDIKDFQRDVEMKTNEEKHLREKAELLLKTVQWYYVDDSEEKQPYDAKANCMIEDAYKAKERGVDFEFQGENLHIDFLAMKETMVGDVAAGSADVIRHEMEKEGNIKLPKTWTSMSGDDQYEEVDLQPTSTEYKTVHDEFIKSVNTASGGYYAVPTTQVLKIQRIQNVPLWHQYMVRKKKMELDNAKSPQPVERILYHGTPVNPVPSINLTGFNRSYSGRNVGTLLGNGVYFAVTASLSAADQYAQPDPNTGHRYMYMARVLSGDMCQGQQRIIVPPAKDPSKPHITYDSVCDNPANPQVIAIFYDTQAYPEYLITFIK